MSNKEQNPPPERKLSAIEEALRREQHNASINAKLLYSGDKFFWRLQESILFYFYLRSEFNCIEVIPVVETLYSELPRIYLDNTVVSLLSRKEFTTKMSEREKNGDVITPDEKEALQRAALPSFILARLQVKKEGDTYLCTYTPSSIDPKERIQLLDGPPLRMAPVEAEKRRRSSTEEIRRVLSDLADNNDALQAATKEAARKIDILKESGDQVERVSSQRAIQIDDKQEPLNAPVVSSVHDSNATNDSTARPIAEKRPSIKENSDASVSGTKPSPGKRPSMDKRPSIDKKVSMSRSEDAADGKRAVEKRNSKLVDSPEKKFSIDGQSPEKRPSVNRKPSFKI